ncbi:MAG: DUF4258 domain-containing protein [Candidatus Pacebacteria bacterium]|jgi:uncharacterized DUF497 family protein|nr:DUF4258 domain-containing protein [Candidatus Paceibacterota bacterium]
MKYFDWDNDKNKWLMENRGISFEFIKECIENGKVVGIVANHPPYEHQRVYLILIEDYIYEVPYVEEEEKIFLKTAYPSHEETKRFREVNNQNKN